MPSSRGSLSTYDQKRDFTKTREPRGAVVPSGEALRYVIQKHDATRLHYDLRLEMGGVYKSWAVPKGPSLDPRDKRLAVETEDHPIAYGTFEGIIPEGEYGGGTVLLWDEGTFVPEGDPQAAYDKGHIVFSLEGKKLHGRFHLVRTKKPGERQTSWLLMKSKDEAAQAGATVEKLTEASVKTGRSLTEIAEVGEQEGAMPSVIEPMLCRLVDAPPKGEQWLHEPKIDGYRVMVRKEGEDVRLFTRGGLDWTDRFPDIRDAVATLPVQNVILDGEVAVLDGDGQVQFAALQKALSNEGYDAAMNGGGMVCFLFDCLFLEGHDLRAQPLVARKQVLFALLDETDAQALLPVPHDDGDGDAFFEKVRARGLEGMVSKRRDAAYVSGRGDAWQKLKATTRQELVVVGFAESDTGPQRIGALLLAARGDDGALVFVGKVGTGFTAQDKRDLYDLLHSDERSSAPIEPRPRLTGIKKVHWVEPRHTVEVAYGGVTNDGILRHASYQGLRLDKSADDVPLGDLPRSAPGAKATAKQPPAKKDPANKKTSSSNKTSSSKASPSSKARQAKTSKGATGKTAEAERERADVAVRASAAVDTVYAPRSSTGDDVVLGVRITSPDRVIYDGDPPVTKLTLARYVEAVAPLMLPYVRRRPLAVVRCPTGPDGQCFFQKHLGKGMPESVRTIDIMEGSGTKAGENQGITVEDAAGVVGLVQMGVLELHPWGAAPGDPERPDRMIFDLDPSPELPWERVVEAALDVKERLLEDDLTSFVKCTGGKGLHVEAPLSGANSWDEVKAYAKAIADQMEQEASDRYTSNMRKDVRKGRVFVDYLRNGRGATAIAPYSMRARPGAAIACPLRWEDIDDVDPAAITVITLGPRLAQMEGDPWADYFKIRQSLPR